MPTPVKQLALTAAQVCDDKKATDIKVLDVAKLTTIADYFILCSVNNERQARAIADELRITMKGLDQRELGVEGIEEGRWVLQDFGAVVAHIFLQDHRNFYDLEGLWADAKLLRWKTAAAEPVEPPKRKKAPKPAKASKKAPKE